MQHDRGCVCQECASSSATDTVLIGLMMIGGVILAITTASRLIVALAVATLIGMVVYKLRQVMPRHRAPRDDASGKGLG
jgi:hypothetical protein